MNKIIVIRSILAATILAGLLFCASSTTVQANEPWSQEYTFGGIKNDYGRDIEITSDGGYIIVGYTRSFETGNDDIYLVKIDSEANKTWERSLGQGWGHSVQQTTDGGYIITGTTLSTSYGPRVLGSAGSYSRDTFNVLQNICLIKTDYSGNITWRKEYGSGQGHSVKQTLDGGYIVAATRGLSSANTTDIFLIKTDSEGSQTWNITLGGLKNDSGYSVVQTGDGDYVVAGSTESYGSGSSDLYLAKVDSNGDMIWRRIYGGTNADEAYFVEKTADGGYIVVGSTESYGSGSTDLYLLKTDSDGYLVWQSAFGSAYSDIGRCVRQTIDNGYIAVGTTDHLGTGYTEIYMVRIDKNGNKLSQARFGGSNTEVGWSIQQTTYGGYIIAGTTASMGFGSHDVYVIKTGPEPHIITTPTPTPTSTLSTGNATAAVAWVARYDSNSTGSSNDFAKSIAVDNSGNVYVTGHCWSNSTGRDYATVKYNNDGTQVWAKRYNGSVSGDDYGNAIAVDSSSNVLVVGNSIGISSSNVTRRSGNTTITVSVSITSHDYATVKYDGNGTQVWIKRYNGYYNWNDYATAVALDGSNDIYVTGYSWANNTNSYDYATIKYYGSGTQAWVQRYDGPDQKNDYANAIVVDAQGNVWITGQSVSDATSGDFTTISYDYQGTHQWTARFDGPMNTNDSAKALVLDGTGGICVTGYTQVGYIPPFHSPGYSSPASYEHDFVTIMYDSFGNQIWTAFYNGPDDGDDCAIAIARDDSRNFYVTGFSQGPEDTCDFVTIKYDSKGNLVWVARYDGPEGGNDVPHDIAIDSLGNIYVTGHSWGGDETGYDYATIKYDSDGNQLWASRYDGPKADNDLGTAIVADSSDNIFVTGYSWGDSTNNDYATVKFVQSADQLPTPTPSSEGNNTETSPTTTPSGNTTNSEATPTPTTASPGNTTTPTPTATPVPSSILLDLTDKTTTDGLLLQYAELATPTRKAVLELYLGTTLLTSEGQPLEFVQVAPQIPPPPPLPESGIVGIAYNYAPDGATFDPPAFLNIQYDPSTLPAGTSEQNLVIAYYDENKQNWIELNSIVDTTTYTVSAEVAHLTVFAILSASSSSSSFNIIFIIVPIMGLFLFALMLFYLNAKGAKRLQELGDDELQDTPQPPPEQPPPPLQAI